MSKVSQAMAQAVSDHNHEQDEHLRNARNERVSQFAQEITELAERIQTKGGEICEAYIAAIRKAKKSHGDVDKKLKEIERFALPLKSSFGERDDWKIEEKGLHVKKRPTDFLGTTQFGTSLYSMLCNDNVKAAVIALVSACQKQGFYLSILVSPGCDDPEMTTEACIDIIIYPAREFNFKELPAEVRKAIPLPAPVSDLDNRPT